MKRINVQKKELEDFLDSIKSSYAKTDTGKKSTKAYYKCIDFDDFKKHFCNEWLKFSRNIKEKHLHDIYEEWISSKSSHPFFKELRAFIIQKFTENVFFCPYCWKSPLIHFDDWNENMRLFQFDHFFPKDSYHEWIINFYNLIPSCNACNHLKLEDNPLDVIIWGGTVFHPYFWNLYKKDHILKKDYLDNKDVTLTFTSDNWRFYKLWEKYLNSEDTFNEFNFISDKRNKILAEKMLIKKYWKLMKWKKQCKSDEELKDYFFNWYYSKDEQDILKYNNGKMKKDLIWDLHLNI